jgi:hypothetical protein
VSNIPELKQSIFEEGHKSILSIHPRATKMYQDLKEILWWASVKNDIAEFVCACLVLQKLRVEHQESSGLMQPLSILDWKWDNISMDFVRVCQITRSEELKGKGDCIGESDMGRTSQRKRNMRAVELDQEVLSGVISFSQFSRTKIL